MGYACPVCETPQSDAGHLANHLAITAIARGGDHEAWLDEHVPGWADLDEAALAERVVDHAAEADYPQVFEDTTGGADHGHDHGPGERDGRAESPEGLPVDVEDGFLDDDVDGDAEDIVARARELTRRRRADAGTAEDDEPADDSETE